MLNKWIRACIAVVAMSVVTASVAEIDGLNSSNPHELVQTVTGHMIEAIANHREGFDENPDAFFEELDELLQCAVDFKWISYNVMGSYRKRATAEQRQRFAKVFRRELIETYGRGLVSYGDQTIVVFPPKEDIAGKRKVTVFQEIQGTDAVYPLEYTMGLNRDGAWKITNVVINGINLGKTFRNQFLQRAQKFGGDIDLVIENWAADVEV